MFGPEAGPADPLIIECCVLRCRCGDPRLTSLAPVDSGYLLRHMHLGSMFSVPTCPGQVARWRKKVISNYLSNV